MPNLIFKTQKKETVIQVEMNKERYVIESKEPITLTNDWQVVDFSNFKELKNTFTWNLLNEENTHIITVSYTHLTLPTTPYV